MRRVVLAITVLVALTAPAFSQNRALVFRGATVYPVFRPPLEHGVVVIGSGEIKAVGAESQVAIPPDATVVNVSGKVINPGIVDSHSHVGIGSRPAVPANADVNESTGPVQPALRALDAIWPADRVGSLETGKDGDVALFDGDPFEYTSHVEAVLVNGEVVYRKR